ncbi:hypothetical protein [Rubritalea tangerina]|uniref:Uncharacterized protein n=1 Tax=Rubritalea tangerina TaxID=430798 RepID=A0ABW4ZE40_9BACT
MKLPLSLTLIIAACSNLSAEWQPFIEQVTYNNDGEILSTLYLDNVDSLSGTTDAAIDITDEDAAVAKFTLTLLNVVVSEDGNHTTIETHEAEPKYVHAYLPQFELNITSNDSHNGIAKTRIGSTDSYQVTANVSGLSNLSDAPSIIKSLKTSRSYNLYNPQDNYSVSTPNTNTSTLDDITQNNVTQLPKPSTYSDNFVGEEVYTISTHKDPITKDTKQVSSKVVIWPMTYGSINGMQNDSTVRQIDNLTVQLTDIYPGYNDVGNSSFWDVICYKGPKKSDLSNKDLIDFSTQAVSTTGHTTPSSVIDRGINMEAIQAFVEKNGSGNYTFELVQSSIHGIDRLDSLTVKYHPKIFINGSVTSQN